MYNILGINELIATSEDNYVNLAVEYANDYNKRKVIEDKIKLNNHKFFHQKQAVENWSNLLKNIVLNV